MKLCINQDLTWPYLPTVTICSVWGRKSISEIQIGTLNCNQSWATFFSRNIRVFLSISNNFNSCSWPPVAITCLFIFEWRILSKFSPAFIINPSSSLNLHNFTSPDLTAVRIALRIKYYIKIKWYIISETFIWNIIHSSYRDMPVIFPVPILQKKEHVNVEHPES